MLVSVHAECGVCAHTLTVFSTLLFYRWPGAARGQSPTRSESQDSGPVTCCSCRHQPGPAPRRSPCPRPPSPPATFSGFRFILSPRCPLRGPDPLRPQVWWPPTDLPTCSHPCRPLLHLSSRALSSSGTSVPGHQGNLPARPPRPAAPLSVPGGQGARQTCPAGAGSSLMQEQLCLLPLEGRGPARLGHSWDRRWHWPVWKRLENKHPPGRVRLRPGSEPHGAPAGVQGGATLGPGLPEGQAAEPHRSGPGPGALQRVEKNVTQAETRGS